MFTPTCVAGQNVEHDDESIEYAKVSGMRTVRIGWDADWDLLTKWSGFAALCALAKARGLGVDLEVVATKTSTGRHYGDPNVRAFITWAATQATKLGLASISFLNEGNHQPFIVNPSAARWANTMVELLDLVRSVNPTIACAWGGLAPEAGILAWEPFLDAAHLANPRIAEFRAGGFHPYCYPSDPTKFADWWNAFGMLDRLDAKFRAWRNNGSTIEVWLTEFGAPTIQGTSKAGAYAYSEKAQALWLAKYVEAMSRTKATIGRVHYYRDADAEDTGASTNREDFMGLRHHDRTEKPAACVYRAFAWGRR